MAELGSRTFALSRGFTCSKPVCGRKAETAISIRGKEDIGDRTLSGFSS